MKILIDNKEPNRNKKYLEDLGFETEIIQLPIGDYLYEEKGICFERKEIPDFINSIKSGHLLKQIMQMEENYKYNYLIIIGFIDDYLRFNTFSKWGIEQQNGSMASIVTRHNIKILNVKNNKQATDLIKRIIDKTDDGKIIDYHNTELLKNKLKTEDIYLKMLLCIDGLGLERARKILEKWSFWDLRNVTIEQLKEIDGIGSKLAEKIKKYMN